MNPRSHRAAPARPRHRPADPRQGELATGTSPEAAVLDALAALGGEADVFALLARARLDSGRYAQVLLGLRRDGRITIRHGVVALAPTRAQEAS